MKKGAASNRVPTEKLNALMDLQSKNASSAPLKKYTWKSLDQEVRESRKILVVANGKYVYDATQWIHSHPGGKVILYSVAGTDITMDFFREAGYDASQFVAAKTHPDRRIVKHAAPEFDLSSSSTFEPLTEEEEVQQNDNMDEGALSCSSIISASVPDEVIQRTMMNASFMTSEDWAVVERSRRTHGNIQQGGKEEMTVKRDIKSNNPFTLLVHTRMALERLSTILVGEIQHVIEVPNGLGDTKMPSQITLENASTDGEEGMRFDASEYRRYTLTDKTQLTEDAKYWKLKFASLYPYDVRSGQPAVFLQGQAVEIQIRLSDGTIISRYYTPVHGSLTAFEIIVKMTGGQMTSYLECQRPGDKQFKIRGPFGSPFVSNDSFEKQIVSPNEPTLPSTTVFISKWGCCWPDGVQ